MKNTFNEGVHYERERIMKILEKEKATWARESIGYNAVKSVEMAIEEHTVILPKPNAGETFLKGG